MTRIAIAFALFTAACIMPPQGGNGASTGPAPTSSSSSSSEPMASTPTPTPASTAPAAPTTVSVTIRSSCSKTAKVFYGDKPGFSSGTRSSVSSNSVSSQTFRVGDQMWILDDSDKGIGNVTISAGTREIEVSSSCTSLSMR